MPRSSTATRSARSSLEFALVDSLTSQSAAMCAAGGPSGPASPAVVMASRPGVLFGLTLISTHLARLSAVRVRTDLSLFFPLLGGFLGGDQLWIATKGSLVLPCLYAVHAVCDVLPRLGLASQAPPSPATLRCPAGPPLVGT